MPLDEDPFKATPNRFVGKTCSFDFRAGSGTLRRLVGVVEAQKYIGRTKRGAIPDYEITVRGSSGKAVTISLVESYTTFPE